MALTIYPYQKISELYRLEFLDSTVGVQQDVVVVTPNPQVADLLRLRLEIDPKIQNVQVVTIANFIKKQLSKYKCPNPVLRKADIMLHFSTVWSKYFPSEPFSLFQQAYEIFSDWRSYSLQLQNFEEALDSLEPTIKKAVVFFWTYIDGAEFFDEHGAYNFLANIEVEDSNNPIILYGFTHLSGVQLGMLQNYSRTNEIILPIAQKLLEKIQYSDWIAWIQSDLLKTQKMNDCESKFKWKTFESSTLNQVLSERKNPLLVLGANDQIIHFSEVHLSSDFFKLPYDFLINDFKEISEQLNLGVKQKILVTKFLERIQIEKEKTILHQQWGKLKVLELFDQSVKFVSPVTSEIDIFYFSVIKEAVSLNLPRTYVVTLKEFDDANEIYKSDYLWAPNLSEKIDIVVKSNDTIFKNKSVSYTANVYKVLATLGPVQRLGLRAEWLTEHLRLLLEQNANLLIDEEILESNAFWKKFLKNSWENREENDHLIPVKEFNWVIDANNYKKKKNYSPSEIQTYLDCPRKYFVTYVEPFEPKVRNEYEFTASDIGEFEHEIIKLYFEEQSVLNEEYLFDLCTKYLSKKMKEQNKKIDLLEQEVLLDEIVQYAFNGLSLLMPLKNLPNFKFNFEKEFISEEENIKGRIDLYFTSDSGNGILDFKRNKVPAQKEVFLTENVQLWSYLFGLNFDLENTFVGYVSLSEPENSWGFGANFENLSIKNVAIKNADLVETSKSKIQIYLDQLKNELNFEIQPKKKTVCLFCPASFTCNRGSLT